MHRRIIASLPHVAESRHARRKCDVCQILSWIHDVWVEKFLQKTGIGIHRKTRNPEIEMKRVIIIRHGERIDETDPDLWMKYCRENYDSKSAEFDYRMNDPYLTEEGCQQAQEVAESLFKEIPSDELTEIPFIYCSKLVRSVQTAYHIALKLSKPIVLSKGFAMTAAAVEMIGDEFEFLPLSKLQELCPGVEFIDGDVEIAHSIPSQSWIHPIHHVVGNHQVSLIVAHRESIRNLAKCRLRTPYCCYGVFHVPHHSRILDHIELMRLAHRDGNEIDF
jgi:hypothetical protein